MNTIIIFSAKYLIAFSVLLPLLYIWRAREKRVRFLILAAISLPLSYVIAKIGGHFYFDPRPFVETGATPLISHAADNGFPSDHTLLAAAMAAVMTRFNGRMAIALWIIALVIGAARVAAGVHHSIDILGSIIIAAATTALVAWLLQKRVR